jgi:hypothetical protein
MSNRLFDFYRSHYTNQEPIANDVWQNLLSRLNKDAAAQENLFWGRNEDAVVYGRSQKIASLIGKYLVSTLLIGAGRLTPVQQQFMNKLIDSLPAVIDRKTIVHVGRLGARVFHDQNGIPRPWTTALGWNDFLGIQDAIQNLATGRCCRSKAIYELGHIW